MGRKQRALRTAATDGYRALRGAGCGHGRVAAACMAMLLALMSALPARAEPGWQPIGRARGVEAWSAQTPTGIVRIGFRNASGHPVAIRVERALIWCGSQVKGEGRPIETRIEPFDLARAEFHADPAWRRSCREPNYFVEFRGLTIERR